MPGITIEFRTEGLTVPLAHRHALQGLIYHLLEDSPGFSSFLHEGGYTSDRKFKLFTFSHLKGRRAVQGRYAHYADACYLEIRSPDGRMTDALASALARRDTVELYRQALAVEAIRREECRIAETAVKIRMLSPVTAHLKQPDGKVRYLAPEEEAFPALIRENYRRKRAAWLGAPVEDGVEIAPVEVTPRDKCVTRFKGTSLCGYYGVYSLSGNPEALTFLYDAGIGARNSQGFGMFAVISD